MSATDLPPLLRLPPELRGQIVGYYLSGQLPFDKHYPDYFQGGSTRGETRLSSGNLRRQCWSKRMHEHDHALFYTCRTLRRDYVEEVNNPARDHLLHVFHVGPLMVQRGYITETLARNTAPISRIRKLKIDLTVWAESVRVTRGLSHRFGGVSRAAMGADPLKHVMAFITSLKLVEEVTVRLWDAQNFGRGLFTVEKLDISHVADLSRSGTSRCPFLLLATVLQGLPTVQRLEVIGHYARISRVRRGGEWMSLKCAQALDEKEKLDRQAREASEGGELGEVDGWSNMILRETRLRWDRARFWLPRQVDNFFDWFFRFSS
ncbi:hypothetical protein FKW77_009880 [Venturia effusa]|uniref:Uncharacterized protein n=1 Tax=Venturia effusa TaxID=50376 RepID=A0A517L259_9PEZI|nr:hypothetical protein FKW77_009880 [Venturia effusa]